MKSSFGLICYLTLILAVLLMLSTIKLPRKDRYFSEMPWETVFMEQSRKAK